MAAERIVAERGMPALTLKDVQLAANQANKSAAKYHFGLATASSRRSSNSA